MTAMTAPGPGSRTVEKTCNLCEAACGLLVEVAGNRVASIRPDEDDPFSRGHICPKAFALREVEEDPDRLRFPVRRTARGFERISWEEALALTAARLVEVQRRGGRDAVATFVGNPVAHNFATGLYAQPLIQALSSRARFSTNSLDSNPKLCSSLLLFGNLASIPVPDLDRTSFLLILGANPLVSNGSVMTAPDVRARLRAIQARGGKIVVVDPRRTETARIADEHIFIRPGGDAALLAALIEVVIAEELGRAGPATARISGLTRLAAAVRAIPPEVAAGPTGIEPAAIRRLARELAGAPAAACYGRIGTCNQEYGTLASWLVDALNILTGNLDRPGGAMFATPAVDLVGLSGRLGLGGHLGRWKSRVRGAPEFNDEIPAACLAEEILTPGRGQVRGLLTFAANPVLSAPNGRQLDRALASLDFFAAVDIYVNETTRHAHVILPPTWSLEHDNYEALAYLLAVRNVAKYSPPVLAPEPGTRHDWEILSDLLLRVLERRRPRGPLAAAFRFARRAGLAPAPRRVLDWLIRLGPHGDRFLPWSRGLNLRKLERRPKGVDLGPLEPSLGRVLQTKSGRIELDHPVILRELARLAGGARRAAAEGGGGLVLVGRRDVRTNNSWGHNAPSLARGRPRCTLLMSPRDAERLGLEDGAEVRIASRVGEIVAPLEVSDEMMPGVVSLPHGWGHDRPGIGLRVAAAQPGVSVNDITDEQAIEPVVGNAILNGVPVTVAPIAARVPSAAASPRG
jgi:anaerobic selenocysteine-containing dehydrogenase